jgi:hypothetical protein
MNDIEQETFDKAIQSLRNANAELLATEQKLHDFQQEVSDAVGDTLFMVKTHCDGEALALVSNRLMRFIIPAPKPDLLVEAMKDLSWDEETAAEEWAKDLRAALEARGLEIREKGE